MVRQVIGACTIEVTQHGSSDGKPALWSWAVSPTERPMETIAQGISFRSVREAIGCAHAIAIAMIEGDEMLRRAIKYLGAVAMEGRRWAWVLGDRRWSAHESSLCVLGQHLTSDGEGQISDYLEWARDHAEMMIE